MDVGHPTLFRVRRFPMPNNEESDENPDQRRYQEELAHKTALLCFISLFREYGTLRSGNVQVQTG